MCFFVGNYTYLHVKKPGLARPLVEEMGQADYVSYSTLTLEVCR